MAATPSSSGRSEYVVRVEGDLPTAKTVLEKLMGATVREQVLTGNQWRLTLDGPASIRPHLEALAGITLKGDQGRVARLSKPH